MSSKTVNLRMHSAAWRISGWATLAFACGTMVVFVFLTALLRTTFSGAAMHGFPAKWGFWQT